MCRAIVTAWLSSAVRFTELLLTIIWRYTLVVWICQDERLSQIGGMQEPLRANRLWLQGILIIIGLYREGEW